MKEFKDMRTMKEMNEYLQSEEGQKEIKEVEEELAKKEAEEYAKINSDGTFAVPEIPFSEV